MKGLPVETPFEARLAQTTCFVSVRVVQCRVMIRVSSESFDLSGRATSRTPWGQCILLVPFLCEFTLYRIMCLRVSSYVLCVRSAVWSSCVVVCPSPSVVSSGVDLAR